MDLGSLGVLVGRWQIPVAFLCVSAISLACSDAPAPENSEESNLEYVKWFYSSTPVSYREQPFSNIPLVDQDRGELLWFSPSNVQVADIKPGEPLQDHRDDPVTTLELIYIPSDSAESQSSWGGLVTRVPSNDADISQKAYLDVWLNDYIPIERAANRRGYLYIDVGRVSEDAVWDPLTPPLPRNLRLDYEDQNLNGGQVDAIEDRGLDWLFNEEEPPRRPGTKTFSPFTATQDPAGDDAGPIPDKNAPEHTIEQRISKYRGINGTEGSDRLEGEDLNGDYEFETENSYREYKIPLADSADTDNRRDFPVSGQDLSSGWRMYHIPLANIDQEVGGLVNLTRVRQIRLWVRGIAPGDTLDLQVGGLQLGGTPTPPDTSVFAGSKHEHRH